MSRALLVMEAEGAAAVDRDNGRILRERIWRRLFAANTARLDRKMDAALDYAARDRPRHAIREILDELYLSLSNLTTVPQLRSTDAYGTSRRGWPEEDSLEGLRSRWAQVNGAIQIAIEGAVRADTWTKLVALASLLHRTANDLTEVVDSVDVGEGPGW